MLIKSVKLTRSYRVKSSTSSFCSSFILLELGDDMPVPDVMFFLSFDMKDGFEFGVLSRDCFSGFFGYLFCVTSFLNPSIRDSVKIPSPNLKENAYLKISEFVMYLSRKTSFHNL